MRLSLSINLTILCWRVEIVIRYYFPKVVSEFDICLFIINIKYYFKQQSQSLLFYPSMHIDYCYRYISHCERSTFISKNYIIFRFTVKIGQCHSSREMYDHSLTNI